MLQCLLGRPSKLETKTVNGGLHNGGLRQQLHIVHPAASGICMELCQELHIVQPTPHPLHDP